MSLNKSMSRLPLNYVLALMHLCSLRVSEFSPILLLKIKHFICLGWGLQHSTHQVILYPEAWWLPVGTSAHDAFDTGILAWGSFFLSSLFFPAHHATLYFWMQNLTDHIELQSIFFLFWRSKRALFMCISMFWVLQCRSPSVITAPCSWVHPCPFVCMNVGFPLCYCPLGFMVGVSLCWLRWSPIEITSC